MNHIALAIWLEVQFQLWIDEASKITTFTRTGWNRRAWFLNCCIYDNSTPRKT